jgi:hypothetical protein
VTTASVLRAANDHELALERPLSLFSFTLVPAHDVPVACLRVAADKLCKGFYRMVEKRRRTIVGSIAMFETLPSKVDGTLMEADFPHIHGIVGVSDETSKSLRAFRGYQHFEKIDNLKSAGNWIQYATKAKPLTFEGHWSSLLSQPTTFVPRIEQLKNFQVMRSSGLFSARAA